MTLACKMRKIYITQLWETDEKLQAEDILCNWKLHTDNISIIYFIYITFCWRNKGGHCAKLVQNGLVDFQQPCRAQHRLLFLYVASLCLPFSSASVTSISMSRKMECKMYFASCRTGVLAKWGKLSKVRNGGIDHSEEQDAYMQPYFLHRRDD